MKKLFYTGVLSALLLAACGEEEYPVSEESDIENPSVSDNKGEEEIEVDSPASNVETETTPVADTITINKQEVYDFMENEFND